MLLKNMLSRRASSRLKNAHASARVRGFALAELAIVVLIAGMMIISGMTYTKRQLQNDTAHALAEQYKTVNNAVGTYMVNHWPDLVAMPQICGNSTWLVDAAPVDPLNACSKTLGGATVVNALQPTIANLVNLGYLQQGQAGPLLLPDATDVRQFNGTAAPHTFGIRIEVVCTNTTPPTTNLALCPDPTLRRDLRSVVFNTRPYANVDNQLYNILGEALRVLPNDAGMSIPLVTNIALNLVGRANPGAVDTIVDNNFVNIPNPVQVSGAAGQVGILGVRGGYGSSGFQQFARRDGSAPPSAPWDFNNQNLTGVKQFNAENITGTNINAVNSFKIPIKVEASFCNASVDNLAWDNSSSSPAVLVCEALRGIWVRVARKKSIDPTQFLTVSVALGKGESQPLNWFKVEKTNSVGFTVGSYITLSTAEWGMPSVALMQTPGMTIDDMDSHCAKINIGLVAFGDHACAEVKTDVYQRSVVAPTNFEIFDNGGTWTVFYDSTAANFTDGKVSFTFYKIVQ